MCYSKNLVSRLPGLKSRGGSALSVHDGARSKTDGARSKTDGARL